MAGKIAGTRTRRPGPALLLVVGVAAVLDLLLVLNSGTPTSFVVLLLLLVPVIALRGSGTDGGQFAAAVRAATLSLVGSIGLSIGSGVDERWAPSDFGLAEGAALTLVLVACFRLARGRQWVVTALVAIALLALPLRLGWNSDVMSILLAAVAVGAVAAATGSALRAADVSHRSVLSATRRAEREEMARELHDVVAHHVTGMVVLSQAARAVADELTPADGPALVGRGEAADRGLDDALANVERAGAEALASLRSMVAVLRSNDPDGAEVPTEPTAGGADLVEVVRRFRDSGAATSVDLTIEPEAQNLPAPVGAAVHRVVQESLTNVSRYARGAEHVGVALVRTGTHVVVTVTDSGGRRDMALGPDGKDWSGGFGIIGMRERVSLLGGTLDAGRGPDGGWTVRAQVPT